MRIILDQDSVDAYLIEHGLEVGCVAADAVLLQHRGTKGGAPAAMIIATVGGEKHVIKMTLNMLIAATAALGAAAERVPRVGDRMCCEWGDGTSAHGHIIRIDGDEVYFEDDAGIKYLALLGENVLTRLPPLGDRAVAAVARRKEESRDDETDT